tara:strand:- start:86 stop:232 length:147 start_codon:yes stop_codon:yes gene_type:complete
MHGIITMLRALRYELEKPQYEELLDEYEDTLCNAEDLLMDSMDNGGWH